MKRCFNAVSALRRCDLTACPFRIPSDGRFGWDWISGSYGDYSDSQHVGKVNYCVPLVRGLLYGVHHLGGFRDGFDQEAHQICQRPDPIFYTSVVFQILLCASPTRTTSCPGHPRRNHKCSASSRMSQSHPPQLKVAFEAPSRTRSNFPRIFLSLQNNWTNPCKESNLH